MRFTTMGPVIAGAAAVLALAACSDMGWNSGSSGTPTANSSGSTSGSTSGTSGRTSGSGMNSGGSAAANDEATGSRSSTPEANVPTQQ